ncbi:MAG TPA: DUF2065 family protein [Halothiobacillus sp.]|nr:DUF2065 family protein [Halothiobacillus sp.]
MAIEIWAALALVLIIEGLLPFISPGSYRRMVQQMAELPDQALRLTGLFLITVGLLVLWLFM